MKDKKKYTFTKVVAGFHEALNERQEWEAEWRTISDYLLPGRGIYQTYTKPRKRRLTSSKVVNGIAEDALYVLTSGMHGSLTSPSRPWFKLEWADPALNDVEELKFWLEDCEKRLHDELHNSNFYSIINSFYIEYAGFGTGCIFVGEDSETSFHFELLTAGEYAFAIGSDGRPCAFYRTLFMTPRQVYEKFPKTCSDEVKKIVKDNRPEIDTVYITILESIHRENFMDKKYIRHFFEYTAPGTTQRRKTSDALAIDGFYEFPYPLARWNTIGSDIYGIGPGARAIPDIKRLQEMEKSFLLATHKAIDPPLAVPSRLKGRINTLPGGFNYISNPNDTIKELYQLSFDYQGVSVAIDRIEQRIQKIFFNDIFLTGARDPNATPYKAMEVTVREQEKMLRLGPVVERLQYEFLQPLIERCFNVMLRSGKFMILPPQFQELASPFTINLVSPLATAQRMVGVQNINSFLAFIAQAAQIDQEVLDIIDPDQTVKEYADITGVSTKILRSQDEVQQIRDQRQKAMMAEKAKQDALVQAEVQNQFAKDEAERQKLQSEASTNLVDAQSQAIEQGII
jgi:hypothetical protein